MKHEIVIRELQKGHRCRGDPRALTPGKHLAAPIEIAEPPRVPED